MAQSVAVQSIFGLAAVPTSLLAEVHPAPDIFDDTFQPTAEAL